MSDKAKQNDDEGNPDLTSEISEANKCLAIGAGVGALGVGAALATGAVCPICFVVAPGIIGAGAFKHWKIRRKTK